MKLNGSIPVTIMSKGTEECLESRNRPAWPEIVYSFPWKMLVGNK